MPSGDAHPHPAGTADPSQRLALATHVPADLQNERAHRGGQLSQRSLVAWHIFQAVMLPNSLGLTQQVRSRRTELPFSPTPPLKEHYTHEKPGRALMTRKQVIVRGESFFLEPLSPSVVRVEHRDQVGMSSSDPTFKKY